MKTKSEKELRCFCRNEPLLAIYGLNKDDQLYIHTKVYKGGRIYGESVVTGAPGTTMKIRCRNCLRWYTVRFGRNAALLEESSAPDIIERPDV